VKQIYTVTQKLLTSRSLQLFINTIKLSELPLLPSQARSFYFNPIKLSNSSGLNVLLRLDFFNLGIAVLFTAFAGTASATGAVGFFTTLRFAAASASFCARWSFSSTVRAATLDSW
jgi:hypothetical protein